MERIQGVLWMFQCSQLTSITILYRKLLQYSGLNFFSGKLTLRLTFYANIEVVLSYTLFPQNFQ